MKTLRPITFCLTAAALAVYWIPGAADLLQYDRATIAQGQFWRLLTGHWTHWSGDQLFWNVLPFAALGAICERHDARRYGMALALAGAAVPLAVWLAEPGLNFYRGLSGLDSALFALLGTELLMEKAAEGRWGAAAGIAALGAGFLLKVAFEGTQGAALFVAQQAGAAPVAAAHLAGAAAGIAAYLLTAADRRLARPPMERAY